MARDALKERLTDCEQFLRDEARSSNPSKVYMDDLKETIKTLQAQIKFRGTSYVMVNAND